ncbi:GPW/gp25 family protein [Marinospirillum perlucidum]|uniref:GPW/gp25 family protein n=1 Tax=Marinospirillum perlucidum TaxID=1982602 RepID=UPI000DF4B9E9|nr:GPW/gp25 family protein [Marinospirillum perlucidum]
MMPLLDRLGLGTSGPSLAEDIGLNLERLVNLRKGTLPLDPRMGLELLPQLQLGADEQQLEALMHAIQEQIRRYEPRLKATSLRMQQIKDALLLQAELQANQGHVEFLLVYGKDQYLQVHLPGTATYQKVLAHV